MSVIKRAATQLGQFFRVAFPKQQPRRRQVHSTFFGEPLEVRTLLAAPQEPVVITEVQFPNYRSMLVTWNPVDGATLYEGWLSSATFAPQLLPDGQPKTPLTEFNSAQFGVSEFELWSRTAPGNRVRLWVRATNDDGAGPWSVGQLIQVPGGPRRDQVQFSIQQPAVYSPPADSGLNVSWESLSDYGAENYEVWVAQNGQRIVNVTQTEMTFRDESLAAGVYTVWVRAKSEQHTGVWSKSLTLAVGGVQPQVTGPVRNEAPLRPEITWSAGQPEVPYQLWVQNVDTGVVINQSDISGTSFTPATDLADGVYSAWGRQVANNGTALPWSARYQFAVGTSILPEVPVLTVSENTLSDDIEEFRALVQWTPAANAVKYELQLTNLQYGNLAYRYTNLTGATFLTEPLGTTPIGPYRAWLRSIGANGEQGEWSRPIAFTVHEDGRIDLISSLN